MSDNKKLWLAFFSSLVMCDHIGDVSNNVLTMLKWFGMEEGSSASWDDLPKWVEDQGVPDLWDMKETAQNVK